MSTSNFSMKIHSVHSSLPTESVPTTYHTLHIQLPYPMHHCHCHYKPQMYHWRHPYLDLRKEGYSYCKETCILQHLVFSNQAMFKQHSKGALSIPRNHADFLNCSKTADSITYKRIWNKCAQLKLLTRSNFKFKHHKTWMSEIAACCS